MRNIMVVVITVLTTLVVFMVLIYYSFQKIEPRDISWEAAQGKKVWDDFGCIQCHALVGNGGYAAPDLTKVVITRGDQWLKNFFSEPPLMPASKFRRHKKLNQEQTSFILEYLRLVGEINTLNWPPSQRKNNLEVKRIN